jgi:glycosyltransferase involved in cell wall biosynthesis
MKSSLKVSIVMPLYNQARFIEKSILSVFEQDYENIELLVIDGGSTDGSMDVLKRYESRIGFLHTGPDKGQSDALNIGFEKATGEIFGWLNSDDLYLPGSISSAVKAFEENPDKQVVFGDWLDIDEDGNIIERNYAYPPNENHFKYEGVSMNAQAMFWRRSVHASISPFDVGLYNTMDYEMVLKLVISNPSSFFFLLPRDIGCFRRYDGQKTGPRNRIRQEREHSLLADRYGYSDKYTVIGVLKRFYFRFRRGFWYMRRGGVSYAMHKTMTASEF